MCPPFFAGASKAGRISIRTFYGNPSAFTIRSVAPSLISRLIASYEIWWAVPTLHTKTTHSTKSTVNNDFLNL